MKIENIAGVHEVAARAATDIAEFVSGDKEVGTSVEIRTEGKDCAIDIRIRVEKPFKPLGGPDASGLGAS